MITDRPGPSRRAVLGATALGLGSLVGISSCHVDRHTEPVPASTASSTFQYGSDPSQHAELYLPAADATVRRGTVVIVHGGFWRAEYGSELGVPLAQDLAARGWAVWNIEYRRVGNGGGWPHTLADVAEAIDHLRTIAPQHRLDLSRLVAVGHSAGGQLATWAAGRSSLPTGAPGAGPAVNLTGVISQAGVLDLGAAALRGVGGTAVQDLLGGDPDQVPGRYDIADPIRRLPLSVPVRCVHSRDDANVPYWQSTDYLAAATAAKADVRLLTVSGDHFTLIDPSSAAWRTVVDQIIELTN